MSKYDDHADAFAYGLGIPLLDKATGRELERIADLVGVDSIKIELTDSPPADFADWTTVKDGKPITHRMIREPNPPTLEQWQAVCMAVKVPGPIAIIFGAERGYQADSIYIVGSIETEDVNRPGYQTTLNFRRIVPWHARTRTAMIAFLRELALWFFAHECNERIEVDGVRAFIPHEEHG